MAADRSLTGAGRLALCACLSAAVTIGIARAADIPARIVLLTGVDRASVVVEVDDDSPKATAIEATDSQSFDVEIGPVHGNVANRLLQAAKQSPLVTEVRVRGVPQGSLGTIIALHVTAKRPVSGLVRRARRRVYIDLEPLSLADASKPGARSVAASPEAKAPGAAAPDARRATRAVERPSAAAADAAAPGPQINGAPPTANPAPPPTAPADAARRAELLARQSDVKGLEKLKVDLIARQASTVSGSTTASDADPVIDQIDRYLDEARTKRLLADAKLFKASKVDEGAAATPAPAAPPPDLSPEQTFQQAIAPFIPELEKMNALLSEWQPGFVPSPNLPQALEALTIRLRSVRPPGRLSRSHERLCAALGTLAKSWVSAPDGVSLIPIAPGGSDARLIMSTKAALYDYLQDVAREG